MASSVGLACAGPDRSGLDSATPTDGHADVRMDVRADAPADHYVAPDVRDVAVDVPHDTGRVCVATCTTDLSCQTSCATPSSGTYCCDTSAGHCYVSASVCPSTTADSGTTMYP